MARAEIGVLQNRAHPSGIIGGIDEKVQVAVDRLGARDAVRQDDCLGKVGGDDGRTFAQRLRQPEAGQRKVADGADGSETPSCSPVTPAAVCAAEASA